MSMKVGVAREIAPEERRVALVPDAIQKLRDANLTVLVERGAGAEASFPDQSYVDAGAKIYRGNGALRSVGYLGARGPNTMYLGFGIILFVAVSAWFWRRRASGSQRSPPRNDRATARWLIPCWGRSCR